MKDWFDGLDPWWKDFLRVWAFGLGIVVLALVMIAIAVLAMAYVGPFGFLLVAGVGLAAVIAALYASEEADKRSRRDRL